MNFVPSVESSSMEISSEPDTSGKAATPFQDKAVEALLDLLDLTELALDLDHALETLVQSVDHLELPFLDLQLISKPLVEELEIKP